MSVFLDFVGSLNPLGLAEMPDKEKPKRRLSQIHTLAMYSQNALLLEFDERRRPHNNVCTMLVWARL